MIRGRVLVPAVLVAAGACFASKGDIRMLQDELRSMHATTVMSDAARRSQLDSISTGLRRSTADLGQNIQRLSDSLRAVSGRLAQFQATERTDFDELARELIQVQSQLGQSVKNLQDVRQAFEERRDQGTAQDSAGKAGLPSALVMFNDSKTQLQGGACAVARSGFEQLLAAYPTFEDAPAAQLYVAESYKCDGNLPAADSVYKLVVAKYPKAPQAATALYKRAEALNKAGKKNEAKALWQSIVKNYPHSDEALLAAKLIQP